MDSKIICYAQNKDLIISEDCLRLLNNNNYKKILDKLADEKKIFVGTEDIRKVISSFNGTSQEITTNGKNYRILDSLDVTGKKLSQGSVEDFLSLFLDKYDTLSEIIKKRVDFSYQTIADAKREIKGKEVHVIGMVLDKRTTKNGNLLLTIDDPTGKVNVVVMENKEKNNSIDEINPKEILMDNVIGIKCSVLSKDLFIAREIMYADIPYQTKTETLKDDCYVVILGDTHVGSKLFREDEFTNFIEWLNAFNVSEVDKKIIEKIKYVIIAGDLVDGIGIYPKQLNELAITDIFEQYKAFEEYILKIPEDIEVFLIPGNHDAVRLSDPQPSIPEKFLPNLYSKKNIHVMGSPSWVELEGLMFLIYHGVSLHGIFGKIKGQKMDRPDLAQKELLKRRDLMPQFGEKQTFIPIEKNFLTMKEIPDVFVCGHIHHHAYSKYKSCHLVSTSCWQSITSYQKELGHIPTVSKAILFNLKNQKLCIKDFEKQEDK
ncbi:MAG TPA: DNA-directed DNA polymerase II small subunit [archaeon]|nr:DNA-directed DNA polymerase II small subunit [archaeon]HPV66094.1 DNA-directed DNA polymerase II small subunit [archaeon]